MGQADGRDMRRDHQWLHRANLLQNHDFYPDGDRRDDGPVKLHIQHGQESRISSADANRSIGTVHARWLSHTLPYTRKAKSTNGTLINSCIIDDDDDMVT